METPSHYIANPDNAHIDTHDFETEVRQLISDVNSTGPLAQYPCDSIHDLVVSKGSDAPNEPTDDVLICRYLSPIKFLWFVSQISVYFGAASNFNDKSDSIIPTDYHNAVLRVLSDARLDSSAWDRHIRDQRSRWLVSCWTKLDNHNDDNLLWHSYADGALGVGVTVRYGVLRNYLRKAMEKEVGVTKLYCGEVAYQSPLQVAPFHKRNIFRNEKEVRFATHSTSRASLSVNITKIKRELGLRLSPESPNAHRHAVERIWRKFGGSDEIHVAGDEGP
jgi:hypothetical protein